MRNSERYKKHDLRWDLDVDGLIRFLKLLLRLICIFSVIFTDFRLDNRLYRVLYIEGMWLKLQLIVYLLCNKCRDGQYYTNPDTNNVGTYLRFAVLLVGSKHSSLDNIRCEKYFPSGSKNNAIICA